MFFELFHQFRLRDMVRRDQLDAERQRAAGQPQGDASDEAS